MSKNPISTSSSSKGWIYIPVEVKVRELQAKTLLAGFAAERGYNVVMGEAHAVRRCLHQMPAGVVLEKGVAPSKNESFRFSKSKGHRVMSWCEEGLVFFDDEDYVRRKITPEDLRDCDCFFAWGPYQADLLAAKFPDMADKILQVGNPRMDLLKPEFRGVFDEEAEALKKKHGKFILINTNFSHCNHSKGADGYFQLIHGKITTPEEEAFTRAWLAHKQALFSAFKDAIPKLGVRYPDHKIIVRPHPGESHNTYRDLFKDLRNVQVIHEGGVMPWLRAAEVLVHNGCFTGIEALLIGCPAIAYRPVLSATYDQYLPNSVNVQADDEASLFSSLDRLLVEKDRDAFVDLPEGFEVLSKHLVNMSGVEISCESILDEVDKLPRPLPNKNRRPWFMLHRLHLPSYLRLYTFIEKRITGLGDRGDYSRQKFKGLDPDELDAGIALFKNVTERFSGLRCRPLGEDLFWLRSK
jgi:surface carbohydrate biosynthesis protein